MKGENGIKYQKEDIMRGYIRIEQVHVKYVDSNAWKYSLSYFDLMNVSDETDLTLSRTYNSWY